MAVDNPEHQLWPNKNLRSKLMGVLESRSYASPDEAREMLEKVLRPLALANRPAFQDLRHTDLVKEWESISGSQW